MSTRLKILTLLIATIFLGHFAWSQSTSPFSFGSDFEEATFNLPFAGNEFYYFVSIEESMNHEKAVLLNGVLESFLTKVESKRLKYKSDRLFLKYLFYKVHSKILKKYTNHALVSSTLAEGKYDCVTGTAIYALILEKLNYDFQIRELDYHIFLEIDSKEGLVVLESTDPVYGFYASSQDISNLMDQFQRTDDESASFYSFENRSDNRVGLKELAGLQYYNKAVQLYNNHEFEQALVTIDKAYSLYKSRRVKEIKNLITAFAKSETVALVQEDY